MGRDYPGRELTAGQGGVLGIALPPLLVAMRPFQWPKNGLVFAAFIFSAGDAWSPSSPEEWWPKLWRTAALFGLWCLAASAVYLLNDIRDRAADQVHPRKRHRPIASGAVSVRSARTTAMVLIAVALPLGFLLHVVTGAILAGYTVVMILYSFGLKEVPIIDVLILVGGVIARAVAGGAAIDVDISPWLYVCSGFGAFFLAISKRWAEYRQLGPEAALHRPALAQYQGEALGQLLTISAATAILAYALYSIESVNVPRNGSMALTVPFAAFGVFRYLLLLNGNRRDDAPDQIVFTDPQIVLAVIGFVVTAMVVMVVNR
ncbi:MAG: UbiA prenyltransferase family protein [Dehalococcoidia bacterium]|nr:UbiA prenyltransferase family protein [Dehalococcoidia bacterium]